MMPAADHQHSTLDVALSYAARGWRVLPITPGKKHPPIPAWQDAATTDADTITSWFTQLYRDHGVGIATGAESGIWVLDVDDYEALRDLERRHEQLPETLTSITGSGGYHLLYNWPADGRTIRNNAGTRLGTGLDVRGDGGQIVAPPSVHPNGTTYQWDASTDEIVDAPGWLLELVCDDDTPALAPTMRDLSTGDRPGDQWAAQVDWAQILEPDGWVLGHVDRRSGERHWVRPGKDRREGTSATTGFTPNDRLMVFTSSLQHMGLDPNEGYSKLSYLAHTRHGGDHAAAARWLRERGYGAPSVADTAVENLVDLDGIGEDTNPLTPWLLDWAEFYATDHNATEWIVEPIFAAGRAHALYAGAKVGKSWLVLAACAAAASGRRFLDQPAGDPVDVLYVDYEMTPDDLYDRLFAFGYTDPAELAHLHYAMLPSLPPLDTDKGGIALTMAALAVKARFVVIDTTSRATQGDENESQTFKEFYRHTGLRLKQQGIGWIRLDHAGKDAEKGQRGSSAKNDDVDLVLKLSRTDDGVQLHATHRRIGWYPERTAITIRENAMGVTTFNTLRNDRPYVTGTAELARKLDALEVPVEWGRKKVIGALREAGETYSTTVLADAIRFRKESARDHLEVLEPRSESGRTPLRTPSYPQVTGHPDGHPAKTPELQGRTPHRTPSDTPPDASSDTPAPLYGGRGSGVHLDDDISPDLF